MSTTYKPMAKAMMPKLPKAGKKSVMPPAAKIKGKGGKKSGKMK